MKKHPMSAAERKQKSRDKMSEQQKEQERHEAQKYGNIAYKNNDYFPVNINFSVIFQYYHIMSITYYLYFRYKLIISTY
jgi:hypothetical protein